MNKTVSEAEQKILKAHVDGYAIGLADGEAQARQEERHKLLELLVDEKPCSRAKHLSDYSCCDSIGERNKLRAELRQVLETKES